MRRDVRDSARGKVVCGERRDASDSARGKLIDWERRDGNGSFGRDVLLRQCMEESGGWGET